jgi:hypothetical protein
MTRHHVPLLRLDLSDGGRAVGWIRGRSIGFRGFATEMDAGTGAWVAHGTVARRLARGTGGGPVPGAVEPLTFRHVDGLERILANGQQIGTLIRPGADSRSERDSFGFEIEIPAPADELRMRSMAHLIYRTLRRSGVRWSAQVPDVTQAKPSITLARKHRASSTLTQGGTPMYNPYRRGMSTSIPMHTSLPPPTESSSVTTFVSRFLLIGMAIAATIALIVTSPVSVTGPLGFVFVAGLFGTYVLSGLERRRQRRGERHGRGPASVSREEQPAARDADSAGRIPSVSAALAVFSISMLGMALLAPVSVGVGVAALGLGGLFVLRISAMVSGWAPRGAAWAGPRRANPVAAV